jgi:hypothetical protein
MKAFIFLLSLSLFPSALLAQDQVATITPEKPKVGNQIRMTYNPAAKTAAIRKPQELTAEVLISRSNRPRLEAVALACPAQRGEPHTGRPRWGRLHGESPVGAWL